MTKGDMRTAASWVARTAELESSVGEQDIVEVDGELGQGDPLRADRIDPSLRAHLGTLLDRGQAEYGRAADEPAADAGLGIVVGSHRELVALAEPALDRISQLVLERRPYVEEGRRAGTAIEVLVGASDGEIHAVLLQADRHRADGMAQ